MNKFLENLVYFIIISIILAFFAFLAFQLNEESKDVGPINDKLEIERVFMHKPGDYSIMYKKEKSSGLEVVKLCDYVNDKYKAYFVPQKLYTDLKAGESMYVLIKGKYNGLEKTEATIEIHIHSPKDINGAEWSTGGKHPEKYQTVPIE